MFVGICGEMMMKKQVKISLLAGLLCVLTVFSAKAWWWNSSSDKQDVANTTELSWENLIPEDFVPMENPLNTMTRDEIDKLFDGSEESAKELAELETKMAYAPVEESLHGKRVRIPGYVVPLDFDGQTKMKEFLLVPYYGACIHTPPPPANQVVHALSSDTVEIEDTYSPVWATGTLLTETITSNLAEAGYSLKIDNIEPYSE